MTDRQALQEEMQQLDQQVKLLETQLVPSDYQEQEQWRQAYWNLKHQIRLIQQQLSEQ